MRNEVFNRNRSRLILRPGIQRFGGVVLCGFILLAASLGFAETEGPVQPLKVFSSACDIPSDGIREELTREGLEEIIGGLNAKLAVMRDKYLWQDGKWETVLRNGLIKTGMWWRFADVTAWVFRTLGDDASAGKTFFFIMPFLNWMCEPFFLPVDSGFSEGQQEEEMAGIARFITLKEEEGVAVSLAPVHGGSLSQDEASRYLRFCTQIIRHLAARDDIEEIHLSLKLSGLVAEWNGLQNAADRESTALNDERDKVAEAKEVLTKLLVVANEAEGKRALLRIDMEDYAYKAATLAVFKNVVEENPSIVRNADGTLRLGIVIQACLRDAYQDLDDLARWGKRNDLLVPVTLAKGAYEKHGEAFPIGKEGSMSPVWNNRESIDAGFEKLCEFLMLNMDVFQPAFATDNIRSMAHVMGSAGSYGIGKSEFEFQMLCGMGDEIKEVITTMGYGMRVTVPAGTQAQGMEYALGRFSELADPDNDLTRALRGDYSLFQGPAPRFTGAEDIDDAEPLEALVVASRVRCFGKE